MKIILIIAIFVCLAASQLVQKCPKDGSVVKCSNMKNHVCGIIQKPNKQKRQHFPNHCLACALGGVDFTVEGKCKELPKDVDFCSPKESKAENCPKNLQPTCGWFGNNVQCLVYPCAVDGYNRCDACRHPNVLYTTEGPCPTSYKK